MQIGENGVVGCDEAANAAENTLDKRSSVSKVSKSLRPRGESQRRVCANGDGEMEQETPKIDKSTERIRTTRGS